MWIKIVFPANRMSKITCLDGQRFFTKDFLFVCCKNFCRAILESYCILEAPAYESKNAFHCLWEVGESYLFKGAP